MNAMNSDAKMLEIKNAKMKALHILSKMDKTEADLRAGLSRTGFSDEAVGAAIAYVKSYGYINDQAYAEKYVMCYKEKKSKQKMKYELLQKGIDREMIDIAFEACQDYDEKEAIRRAIRKKWKSEEKPDEKTLYKIFASISRQGYISCNIWQVLEEENLT